ncbi:MAG TPA: AsmA-like C-terminal region-containing protein [Rubrivivax sp.]
MQRCPATPSPARSAGRLHLAALLPLSALLAVVVALAACEWAEWPFLRAPIERAMAKALDRTVVLDPPFGVRLIGSVRVRTGSLRIGPPTDGSPTWRGADGQALDLLNASAARLRLPYSTAWRLLRGDRDEPLEITLLDVDQLEVNLKRDATGRASWPAAASAASAASAATRSVADTLPRFGTLRVGEGVFRVDDAPLKLKLEATLRTREGSAAAAAPATPASAGAGLELRAKGSYRGLPLTALMQSSGLLPLARSDGSDPSAAAVPIWLDLNIGRARLQLDGSGTDLLNLAALQAKFNLSGPSLAAVGDAIGLTLPTTGVFSMRGNAAKQGALWTAAVQTLQIGSSRLRGDFRFDTAPAVPLLSGTLAGSRLALADLGPAFGTATADTPSLTPRGRVFPQREFDIPSLRAMNADVLVDLDRADLGSSLLEPLTPLRGRIRLGDGVLSLQDLVARTAEGTLRGMLTVDARQPMPRWTADLRVHGLQLERFLKPRNARSVEAPAGATPAPAPASASASAQRGYVSGLLGASAQVSGEGRSTAAVMASLDGQARLWVRRGGLSHLAVEAAGIDVAESLGLLIVGDKTLPMRCAVAQLSLRNGRALPDPAVLDTADTTLLVSGELSLADESLALVLTARPHDFSPLSLRAPVRLTGSFSAPQVKLDARSIGLRAAAAAALGAITPLAALLPLIDFGEGDRNECEAAMTLVRGSAAAAAGRTQNTRAPASAASATRRAR